MTRTYTAKIEIRRWKAHTCVGCGCQYAYLMCRKLAYGGSTPERATEKVQAAAERTMAHDIDRQPCPTCGLFQPDMIACRRRSLHWWLLLAALLAVGLITGLYLGDVMQAGRALLAGMAQVSGIALLGFLVDLHNPNRDLEANRRMAEQEVAAQRVRVLRPGMPLAPGIEPPAMRPHGLLASAAAVLALLALALPELVRQQSAWPLNANWHPPVAGPGDEIYLYLPDSIASVKGYWTGTSKVTAQVASRPKAGDQVIPEPPPGEFAIESSTRYADWGLSIDNVKPSERSTRQPLWVRLKLPSGGEYAGKILVCKIVLTVRYPVIHNDDRFETSVSDFQHEANLDLAAPLAGRMYQRWWWGGFAGGELLLIVSILARLSGAAALRRMANPAEILEEQAAE
jgi:hypothetical protein